MSASTTQRIEAAFAKGKIEMWELFEARVPFPYDASLTVLCFHRMFLTACTLLHVPYCMLLLLL